MPASSQKKITDERLRKRLRNGVKIRLPTIPAGEKGSPHAERSGHAQRLRKSWILR
jgi:hypothetical protein